LKNNIHVVATQTITFQYGIYGQIIGVLS